MRAGAPAAAARPRCAQRAWYLLVARCACGVRGLRSVPSTTTSPNGPTVPTGMGNGLSSQNSILSLTHSPVPRKGPEWRQGRPSRPPVHAQNDEPPSSAPGRRPPSRTRGTGCRPQHRRRRARRALPPLPRPPVLRVAPAAHGSLSGSRSWKLLEAPWKPLEAHGSLSDSRRCRRRAAWALAAAGAARRRSCDGAPARVPLLVRAARGPALALAGRAYLG